MSSTEWKISCYEKGKYNFPKYRIKKKPVKDETGRRKTWLKSNPRIVVVIE